MTKIIIEEDLLEKVIDSLSNMIGEAQETLDNISYELSNATYYIDDDDEDWIKADAYRDRILCEEQGENV